VCGKTYMLTQDEELWEKQLPNEVENLLASGRDPLADRNRRVGGIFINIICSLNACFSVGGLCFVFHSCYFLHTIFLWSCFISPVCDIVWDL